MNHGDLKLRWVPQVLNREFEVGVPNAELGIFLINALRLYDKFLSDNNIVPDGDCIGALSVFDDQSLRWVNYSEDEVSERPVKPLKIYQPENNE